MKRPRKTRKYVKQLQTRLEGSEGLLNDLERPQITRMTLGGSERLPNVLEGERERDLQALGIILKDPNRRQKVSLERETFIYRAFQRYTRLLQLSATLDA